MFLLLAVVQALSHIAGDRKTEISINYTNCQPQQVERIYDVLSAVCSSVDTEADTPKPDLEITCCQNCTAGYSGNSVTLEISSDFSPDPPSTLPLVRAYLRTLGFTNATKGLFDYSLTDKYSVMDYAHKTAKFSELFSIQDHQVISRIYNSGPGYRLPQDTVVSSSATFHHWYYLSLLLI